MIKLQNQMSTRAYSRHDSLHGRYRRVAICSPAEAMLFWRGSRKSLSVGKAKVTNGKLGPLTSFHVDVSRDEQHDMTPTPARGVGLYTAWLPRWESFVHYLHITLGQHG